MELNIALDRLRLKGLRITRNKRQIIALFLSGACGLSIRDIMDTFDEKPALSTVYRCLQRLETAGFLYPDRTTDGLLRYRCSNEYYPEHGHLRCRSCGSNTPFDFELPVGFSMRIEQDNEFDIISSDLIFEGICSSCNEKDG